MRRRIKYIFRAYRYRNRVDPSEINYIRENLKDGSVAVDIGAHKGGYLYWMQKSVKAKGKVFAFEPQVKLYNYLKSIAASLKFKNVSIENLGMSSEEGEVIFYIPISRNGISIGARIDQFNNGTQCEESKIQITTLDKYFFDRQIYPDLIKIDVEGHEQQVLLGGMNLLKSCKPKIVMECENRHLSETSMSDVFDTLFELDYCGYFFENNELKPVKEFNAEIHQDLVKGRWGKKKKYINNFIFEVPPGN